jgi:fructose-specific phosphotransferase system IIC component
MTGSYMRTSGLQNNGVTNTELGGAQVTRRLGRYFSVYAAYTGISQSSTSALSPNAIGGLIQVFTGGIGFTPREFQFRK